ncbi:type II secretion system major pseudopilin GspG [Gemmatimonas sp.]|uniref:type II secretion system major pseudopilin GspG n=1 Tax=Gemmatimonas sp. TaxID=1962908 RepID=UPI00391A9C1B
MGCSPSATPATRTPSIRAHRRCVGRRRRITGFTLLEVMVVIVVIALLATFVAPSLFRNVDDAKVATARAQIESLATALDGYRLDNGRYPTSAQGLNALWEKPTIDPPGNWREPYVRKAIPDDPWGRPYVYVSPGKANPTGFDLASYGADGQPGGDGDNTDILSWK